MMILCRCADLSEAESIRLRLEAEGIQVLISGSDRDHVAIEFCTVRVDVVDNDFDRATNLLLADQRHRASILVMSWMSMQWNWNHPWRQHSRPDRKRSPRIKTHIERFCSLMKTSYSIDPAGHTRCQRSVGRWARCWFISCWRGLFGGF